MGAEAERVKAANIAYWDANASRWRGLGLLSQEVVRAVVAVLQCEPGSQVLDASCGPGQWAVALALEGYRVRGIDISPVMVAAARDRASDHALAKTRRRSG